MNSWNNWSILGMTVLVFSLSGSSANALPDQDANDMLSESAQADFGDNTVRWGVPHHQKTVKKVTPIDESSFNSGEAVAATPGVTGATASRSPASASNAALEKEERKLAAKTIVRNLAKQKAYQEVAVIVNDLGFFPSTLFVTQGIPVRLFVTGASKKSQCFMMDTYGIRRQIQSQKVEEITFVPDETGSFAFNCPMNGAKGNLLVKELELDRIPANLSLTTARQEKNNEEKRENHSKSLISDEDFEASPVKMH